MARVIAPAVAEPPDVEETPLQAFEAALQKRFPNREVRRYEMPSAVRECRAVYLVEVNSRDEINAAIYADSVMTQVEKSSQRLTAEAIRRETMRASLVGTVSRKDPPVYRHIGIDGVAFHEMDDWSAKATASLLTYFNELNGVRTDELLEGLTGARTIGTPLPPKTSAIPKSDASVK